ncbi:PhzF family phenazine biosynthesis protein [Asticcacaulis sp. SL142]|uniref:PhzF family phenazine biosynthesis protein n=1 Tax=Asticcacaulis sp. SL142 TaxID=2995155 RepID=UPI00226C8066|nr:PhzF family phenazine biosynthesis protein [Asticcacaulis sp. SL142]WAC48138.1 PhzF family phenazine biosynthesis protein [Asticcacaulis sp. SL142]
MRQFLIDAFARAPFMGNPAAVVEPFDTWPSDDFMSRLAMENNQAETAYMLKTAEANVFGLRWFTPAVEVNLCGHATLAAAHALFTELGLEAEVVHFDTRHAGRLSVRRVGGQLEMDFPAYPVQAIAPVPEIEAVIGQTAVATFGGPMLILQLASEAAVHELKFNAGEIGYPQACTLFDAAHVVVTAFADAGSPYDVVSRFFAPGFGIAEDPTTGSMHCALMPLYANLTGKAVLEFHQAYPRRGGDLRCELVGDRVKLRGRAITTQKTQVMIAVEE